MKAAAIKVNHCEGWYQAIVIDNDNNTRESAKFPSQDLAIQAIRFFRTHNYFQSERPEEAEEEIKICSECGQPYSNN